MPARTVLVTAPSRLHFGMLSFGHAEERQFGGVGAMIDSPGLRIEITPAAQLAAGGPLAERALTFARRVADNLRVHNPACRLRILGAPAEHAGLGTGTQLALAVAAGLCRFFEVEQTSAAELARLAGRGERSAIGSYGFAQGGLLVEAGKVPGQALAPLVSRVELPAEWRFVLIAPCAHVGLSGEAERAAFARLPAVPRETTAELCREVLIHLLPSAIAGDFDEFSESLYRYGHRAGMCFAANQGGPFASAELADLVAQIRAMGIKGVGQSSWGPTLFALFPNESQARDFADRFAVCSPTPIELTVTAPSRRGATIEFLES